MKNQTAIIWDMDGVLINSEPLYYLADKQMFNNLGIEFTPADVNALVGVNSKMGVRGILKNHPELTMTIEELDRIYKDSLLNALKTNEELCLIPGVLDWIRRFETNGWIQSVASSSTPSMVSYIMERFGLHSYMSTVIHGEMVKIAKPEPDIFLMAANQMDVSPMQCTVIEDSTFGIAAANAAGMRCYAFTGANVHGLDNSQADARFDTYDDSNFNLLFS